MYPWNLFRESTFVLPYLVRCVNKALVKLDCRMQSLHTKNGSYYKAIYKFVSVLPLRSKVFEKMVYEQLYEYLNNYLNELLSGFCKAHWTQHTLFRLIHSWKKSWAVQVWWTLCTLLKANDSLSHDLLIAKLKAYGLDNKAQNWSESRKTSIYDSWKISTAEIWSFNRAN